MLHLPVIKTGQGRNRNRNGSRNTSLQSPLGRNDTPSTKTPRRNWKYEFQKACISGNCEKVRHCVQVGKCDVDMEFDFETSKSKLKSKPKSKSKPRSRSKAKAKSKSSAAAAAAAASSVTKSSSRERTSRGDSVDGKRTTAALIAATNGDVELFKTLLKLGSNPSAVVLQQIEDICVSHSRNHNHIQIMQIMHGARCITPYQGSVAQRQVGKFKAKLAPIGSTRVQKIAVPSGAAAGRMLRYFVLNRDVESAKRLLCTGIDVNFCDNDGVDAMDIAVYGSPNQPDMVMLLMSFGGRSKPVSPQLQTSINALVREHRKKHPRRKKKTTKSSSNPDTAQSNPFFLDPHHLQRGGAEAGGSDDGGDDGDGTQMGDRRGRNSGDTTMPPLVQTGASPRRRKVSKRKTATHVSADAATGVYAVAPVKASASSMMATLPSIHKKQVKLLLQYCIPRSQEVRILLCLGW